MKKVNNAGVTLIELLVTISLLGILVGVSGDLLFTIFRSFNKASTIVNIQEEGNQILNKIKTDAINASDVTVSSTIISLTNGSKIVEYEIVSLNSNYGTLVRREIINGASSPDENLFMINSNQKYKLVITDTTGSSAIYSAFEMKNANSTPKLLLIYLTVIPFSQVTDTPKDLRVEGANSRLRTSIVLRGSYDRIN